MDGQPDPVRAPAAPAQDVSWASALVVDDIAENRDLLVRRLKRLGLADIEEAADGRAALDRMAARRFDLVLLDLMMPVMNGFEVLDVLRAEGRLHEMPVIVISALNEIEEVARCLERGAEDFIFKPFNPTILRARVLSSLEKKQLRDRTREALARKEAELGEARRLQLAMVPPPGERATPVGVLKIEVLLDPAREVGGDLVDHFEVGEHLHAMLLGDVSDKGAGAALVMARTSALFRSLAGRPDAVDLFTEPGLAAAVVNDALAHANDSCMFVTLLLAVLDLRSGELSYVRCGHVPPFVRRASGEAQRLDNVGGLPLGVMQGVRYASGCVSIEPGDAMLVVSDGVTEAAAPGGEMFCDAQASDWLGEGRAVADLLVRVRAFEAGLPPADDVAALLMRLEP